MENCKEQYKKKGEKNWNWNGYILDFMEPTSDTTHFERSPLNADAPENAVQIIQEQQ